MARASFVVIGAALAALLPGLFAVVGWMGNVPALTKAGPAMPAMQFNAAFGLILGALGLLALVADRRRGALAVGALLTVLGAGTIIEYAARAYLGIDNLLFQHPT